MNRPLFLFGAATLAVGLGIGYLMLAHPEGLNPSWPLGMALLAPAAFILAGVHLVSTGLGFSRLALAAIRGVIVCLVAVANWAAWFSARIHCLETISLFGVALLRRQPSEDECRAQLRLLIGGLDALILLVVAFSVWNSRQSSPDE